MLYVYSRAEATFHSGQGLLCVRQAWQRANAGAAVAPRTTLAKTATTSTAASTTRKYDRPFFSAPWELLGRRSVYYAKDVELPWISEYDQRIMGTVRRAVHQPI